MFTVEGAFVRIRNRVMGWGALAMIVASAMLLGLLWHQMLGNAEHVEEAAAQRQASRAVAVVDGKVESLASIALRWSAQVGRSNLSSQTGAPLALATEDTEVADCDLVVLCAPDRRVLRIVGRGSEEGGRLSASNIEGVLVTNEELNPAAGAPDGAAGLVTLPNGHFALVAARLTTFTDGSTSTPATLLAIKVVDASLQSSVASLTGLEVAVLPLDRAHTVNAIGDISVWPESNDVFAGEAVLAGTLGQPVAVLSLQMPRQVRSETVQALRFLTGGVLALIVIAALVLGYVADKVVMRRLAQLSEQVDAVATGRSSGPVHISGHDEISSLARHVDSLVGTQAMTREELQCTQAVLEERVESRTDELRAAVANLREEIEERQRTEEALFESERRFRGLVDSLFDAVLTLDEHGMVLFANAAVAGVFGQQPASVVGSSVSELFEPASARLLVQRLARGISAPVNDLSLKTRGVGGSSHDVDVTLTPSRGPLGVVQGIVRDVTTRRRYENELVHMASHDFLTGLSNRRRFEEEVERAVSQALRRESSGAILWFDLDYFKEVNDTLGHRAGDELLVKVAETLGRTVRSESLLARLGGDEFGLLLYQADAIEARHAAERVLSEIKNLPFSVSGNTVRTSASVGVVLFPEHGVEVEELLTHADVAMYRAKELGRSRWVIYSTEEDWRDDLHRRRSWADRIQRALDEGGLVAFAQPVVNVADGSVRSFELLVRLQEADGTLVNPDAFLGAAERVGLIREVDLWMVREAIALLGEYRSEQLRLEVNLSARTFADPSFFIEVGEMLRRAEVAPERLGIEITERAVMSDLTRVQESLRVIKQLGCRLALDDFGSGFSAFYHLKHLPLDDLKIDGDFVGRLGESVADQHLVRAIVEMARGMGMHTTAEFVQSEGTMSLLKEYGVDHAQGFGVAEPGPAVEVIKRALHIPATPPAPVSAAS